MSTQNFYYNNMLFVNEVEDDFDYDDAIANAQSELKAAFKDGSTEDKWEEDGLRSYPGKIIFSIPVYTRKGDHALNVSVVARSGYYSGMNFDYTIGDNFDDLTEAQYKDTQAKAEAIGRKIARIAPRFATKLNRLGVFSNGEAVYQIA